MLSRLFSNYLKIIKIKDQNSSVIYNYVFLCYLDCFQIFKNENQRYNLKILQKIKPDQYFFTSK